MTQRTKQLLEQLEDFAKNWHSPNACLNLPHYPSHGEAKPIQIFSSQILDMVEELRGIDQRAGTNEN